MQYRIWQHIDSGIEIAVDANSEEEAQERAELLLAQDNPKWNEQILLNVQAGNPGVIEEVLNGSYILD